MAAALKLEAYGVELNQVRAGEAAERVQALAGREELPFVTPTPPASSRTTTGPW
jgi:hypothetical protein